MIELELIGFNICLPDGYFGRSYYTQNRCGFGDGAGKILAARSLTLFFDDAE